ncbi:MAG: YceD family protein [Acidimicrobiia bacterium]
MAPRLHELRLNARELLRQPGLRKSVGVSLPASDLGVDDDRITGEIAVDLVATSNLDGIVVAGTLTMPWRAPCRRCLTEVTGTTTIDIDELYQDPSDTSAVVADDAFPIEGDQVDLVPAVREAVLLELPDDVLCRDDCAGICPVCGVDRNVGSCECDTTVRDERWAALDDLRLDD